MKTPLQHGTQLMKSTLSPVALVLICSAISPGCMWDEGLVIENLSGTVVIPRAAATREFVKPDGTVEELTDVRLIGPVVLGLFPGVELGLQEYPHPSQGPQFQPGVPGDTYPYGGTTVGDFRYSCFEDLTCKVTSGRYLDFDEIVNWFGETLQQPITDALGREVTNGDYMRQTCYELLRVTSDEELRLTAEDANMDGVVDALDLDFVEDADGNFRANFTFWQQEYFEQQEVPEGTDPAGFSLWGWMDAPAERSFSFSTCNPSAGFTEQEYSNNFEAGTWYPDLLNFPSTYISRGDWVACGLDESGECAAPSHVYSGTDDNPEIWLDFEVQ